VRVVQGARRDAGLEVSDRIALSWDSPDDEVVAAMEEHGERIASEVLALSVRRDPGADLESSVEIDGLRLSFTLRAAA